MKIIGWLILALTTIGCGVFTVVQLVTYYPIHLCVVLFILTGWALVGGSK